MNCVRCLWICLARAFVKIERTDVGLKLLGAERLLVWGNGRTSAAFRASERARERERGRERGNNIL